MMFFSQPQRHPAPIEIDPHALSSTSLQVQQTMDRIAENYGRLDLLLSEVELKISSDGRLSAINDSIKEIEIKVDGRKRKWRSLAKTKQKSANPKKPR